MIIFENLLKTMIKLYNNIKNIFFFISANYLRIKQFSKNIKKQIKYV